MKDRACNVIILHEYAYYVNESIKKLTYIEKCDAVAQKWYTQSKLSLRHESRSTGADVADSIEVQHKHATQYTAIVAYSTVWWFTDEDRMKLNWSTPARELCDCDEDTTLALVQTRRSAIGWQRVQSARAKKLSASAGLRLRPDHPLTHVADH